MDRGLCDEFDKRKVSVGLGVLVCVFGYILILNRYVLIFWLCFGILSFVILFKVLKGLFRFII